MASTSPDNGRAATSELPGAPSGAEHGPDHDAGHGAMPASPLELAAHVAAPARSLVPVRIDVDRRLCERYGICEQEAPEVFELGVDGRLRYRAKPPAADTDAVTQAARCCPMNAITLTRTAR